MKTGAELQERSPQTRQARSAQAGCSRKRNCDKHVSFPKAGFPLVGTVHADRHADRRWPSLLAPPLAPWLGPAIDIASQNVVVVSSSTRMVPHLHASSQSVCAACFIYAAPQSFRAMAHCIPIAGGTPHIPVSAASVRTAIEER